MRCCLASPARVLTLISLALVSSQSFFTLAAAQSATGSLTDVPGLPSGDGPGAGSSSSSQPASPTDSSSSSSSHSSSPSHSASAHVSSSTTAPLPASISSSTSGPAASSSSSSSSSQSSLATPSDSSSSSSSSPSSSSSSSVSSSSSSISTSLSSSSSSTSITLISNTGTTAVASPTFHAGAAPDTTSYGWLSTPSASGTDAAVVGAASSKSFFDNKGAVAGVFSVIGVVALGGIIIAVILAKRRAARLQDEEDIAAFEKYPSPGDRSTSPTSFTGGFGGLDQSANDAPLAHAATDAYPDRAMHYGLPAMTEYSQPQPMELSYHNGIDYPPGMAYNPAQYAGYDGGYGAAAHVQHDMYYQQPSRSPSHPYADPNNSARAAGAPPVQHYMQAGDDGYYGEAR